MKNGYVKGRVQYKVICALYVGGHSSTKIAKNFKIGVTSVIRVLHKCKIPIRTASTSRRKYGINDNFFSKIDSEETAYWFGFILADGWICRDKKGGKHLGLGLAKKDKHHLERLRDLLSPGRPLYKKIIKEGNKGAGGVHFKLEMGSVQLFDNLVKLGCTERKSLTLKFPLTIPKKYLPHVIRGYFDGDGAVYITCNIPCISILGTKEFLTSLLKHTNISTTGKGIYRKRPNGKNTFYLQIKRPKRFRKYYEYIYSNATIYLERKKQVFDNYFKQQGCSETIITQPI